MKRLVLVLGLSALLTPALGCKGSSFPFARVRSTVSLSPDARLEGIGRPTEPPEDSALANYLARNGEDARNLRFSPSSPADVALYPGRDRLDRYTVLGWVTADEGWGIGATPERAVDDVKKLAASIGADAVLDVRGGDGHMEGLAARRREGQAP